MDYQGMLDFFYNRTNYEVRRSLPYTAEYYNLQATRDLLTLFDNPQRHLSILHVAGTNGKGSTCFYLEQILLAAGRHCGCFLSPHVERINERIRIDGRDIEDEQLCRIADRMRAALPAGNNATTFELLLGAALLAWVEAGLEFGIVETGVGGRLDSTNALQSDLTCITRVGLDHQRTLGHRLTQIAVEKAGIMKAGVPCIASAQAAPVAEVLQKRARSLPCPLTLLPSSRGWQAEGQFSGSTLAVDGQRYTLAMPGPEQAACLDLALTATGKLGIVADNGLLGTRLARERLPARRELFPGRPPVLLDGAHNPAALRALCALLQGWPMQRAVVAACMADKQLEKMVPLMEDLGEYLFLTNIDSPRAAPAVELARYARRNPAVIPDPHAALQAAIQQVGRDGLVIVGGSFYLAGALRPWLRNYP